MQASTLQIFLPPKIRRKTFKTSKNTSIISDTLTSIPPLYGTSQNRETIYKEDYSLEWRSHKKNKKNK